MPFILFSAEATGRGRRGRAQGPRRVCAPGTRGHPRQPAAPQPICGLHRRVQSPGHPDPPAAEQQAHPLHPGATVGAHSLRLDDRGRDL